MTRVAFIVNTLRLQGIEVGRATAEVKLKEGTYPAGSFVIKRDQPYGRLAKILLEKQDFPDPALTTYDDTGWTMGLMAHAKVIESADQRDSRCPRCSLSTNSSRAAPSPASGAFYAVIDNGSNNLVTLRYRLKDVAMRAVEAAFKSGDQEIPAGSFIVAGSAYDAKLKAAIEPLGLTAVALTAAPTVADARRRSAAPRDFQHLGQHPGSRLGALRVRSIRSAVRPDLQGARQAGQPARGL